MRQRRLYVVEIVGWDADNEPEGFKIVHSIPFSGYGVAEEVFQRGKRHPWKSVTGRFFYPSSEDVECLGIPEDSLLLCE